jgi:hypothetical protein
MAQTIRRIFVDPPIAVARLGGSSKPQDAYIWVAPDNPRSEGSTVIAPWWTLDVQGDGSVEPRMPAKVTLRDGDLIRPVAPFFEIWASVGEIGSARSRWRDVPLTPALLKKFHLDESALSFRFDAQNRKVARRMAKADLLFGTFPPVTVRADDHDVHPLLATSPPGAAVPMIPRRRHIPLGSVQVIRSRPQPKSLGDGTTWHETVNVEVIRFRFTPAGGHFYGPRAAIKTKRRKFGAVEKARAFLDHRAGWYGKKPKENVAPADTYDLIKRAPSTGPSLGVVDDTCETRVTVTLAPPGKGRRPLVAHANIFAGPPDFGPDRRPFLSLADELGDRGSVSAARSRAMSKDDRDQWVEDLFERIYETVSLFNLDHFQSKAENGGFSILLKGPRLRRRGELPGLLAEDHVLKPKNHAMTRRDVLRNDAYSVPASSDGEPLPLSEHARSRHKSLQDIDGLKDFIAKNPHRLRQLIRQPFEVEEGEDGDFTTMRMPPFMRNSNAFPLTLSFWQYDLLMDWVDSVPKLGKKSRSAVPKLSPQAQQRRHAILKWFDKQMHEREYKD